MKILNRVEGTDFQVLEGNSPFDLVTVHGTLIFVKGIAGFPHNAVITLGRVDGEKYWQLAWWER